MKYLAANTLGQFSYIKILPDGMTNSWLIERVYQHQLDAAILHLPLQENKKLITSPLYMEELLLAVPKHHILAKRKAVYQCECENELLLLFDDEHCNIKKVSFPLFILKPEALNNMLSCVKVRQIIFILIKIYQLIDLQ